MKVHVVTQRSTRHLEGIDTSAYQWVSRQRARALQRAFADIFVNIDRLEIVMDDFLIVPKDLQEHNTILRKVLRHNHVTLSKEKLQLCLNSVKHCERIFTQNGLEIDPDRDREPSRRCHNQERRRSQNILWNSDIDRKISGKSIHTDRELLRELIKASNKEGRNWKFHCKEVHQNAVMKIRKCCSEGEDIAL